MIVVAVLCLVVVAITVAADQRGRYFLAPFLADLFGYNCNKVIGVRIMFWAQFVVELAAFLQVVLAPPPIDTIRQYQKSAAETRAREERDALTTAPYRKPASNRSVAISTVLALLLSLGMAYGGSSKACRMEAAFVDVLYFLALTVVGLMRGLVTVWCRHRYFETYPVS